MARKGFLQKTWEKLRHLTQRRAGYLVWSVALAVLFIPELLSAWKKTQHVVHFVTISSTVGHLEYMVPTLAVIPTLLIVTALYSLVRVPPAVANEINRDAAAQVRKTAADSTEQGNAPPPEVTRTPGGRLTLQAPEEQEGKTIEKYDGDKVGRAFWIGFPLAIVVITLSTLAAWWWWNQPPVTPPKSDANFHVGYVLYGLIALGWLLTALFAVRGVDAPFPTLFRTIANFEEWTGKHVGNPVGRFFHWLIPIVLLWGLVFLMIHLSFYPWPEIMDKLNPTAR